MINLNSVVLVGRLTKDPDMRITPNNVPVCQFNVAVNRPKRKGEDETADFIQCVAWRQSAEFLANYASKGAIVSVEGEIRTRNYLNRQGEKVYITEILADKVQIINNPLFISQTGDNSNVTPNYGTMNLTLGKHGGGSNNGLVIEEQELPFY